MWGEGRSEGWVELKRACIEWGRYMGVDSAEGDTQQNRVSVRQCQAVTSKRTSSNTCK